MGGFRLRLPPSVHVLKLLNSEGVTLLALLGLQLPGGRLWGFSALWLHEPIPIIDLFFYVSICILLIVILDISDEYTEYAID